MDEHLDGLYEHCHPILKRLKMGDTGTIQCTKEFTDQEIQFYAVAYGAHKDKWFETQYDKAIDAVRAKRVPLPNWETETEIDPEEEL